MALEAQTRKLTHSHRRSGENQAPPPTEKVSPSSGQSLEDATSVGHELSGSTWTRGGRVTVEKIVAVHTSRDAAISEPGYAVRRAVARAAEFDALVEKHALAWHQLWRRFGVSLEEGNERTARILRLHIFHLLQTLSPHTADHDVGVPARGLHGEAYRGHIFWDELFVFPLLNLRLPRLARALLRYRFRRLAEARSAAREAGFAGGCSPGRAPVTDGRKRSGST